MLGHAEYYPRFGFVPAARFGLRCDYHVPADVFMALELSPGRSATSPGWSISPGIWDALRTWVSVRGQAAPENSGHVRSARASSWCRAAFLPVTRRRLIRGSSKPRRPWPHAPWP